MRRAGGRGIPLTLSPVIHTRLMEFPYECGLLGGLSLQLSPIAPCAVLAWSFNLRQPVFKSPMQLYPCYGLVNSLSLLDQQFPGVTPRGAPAKLRTGGTYPFNGVAGWLVLPAVSFTTSRGCSCFYEVMRGSGEVMRQ